MPMRFLFVLLLGAVLASLSVIESSLGEAGRPRRHIVVAERGGHEPQLGEVRLPHLLDEVAHLAQPRRGVGGAREQQQPAWIT